MKHHVLHVYRFNLGYARQLVADVPDDRMAEQPATGVNHPAWILGHLSVTADFMYGLMGCPSELPREWVNLYKTGSTPQSDRSLYPGKQELLAQLVARHERVVAAFKGVTKRSLSKPTPIEGFNQVFPTIGDAVIYGLTTHEGVHLGQLSAWRRSLGLKNLLSE